MFFSFSPCTRKEHENCVCLFVCLLACLFICLFVCFAEERYRKAKPVTQYNRRTHKAKQDAGVVGRLAGHLGVDGHGILGPSRVLVQLTQLVHRLHVLTGSHRPAGREGRREGDR